jgi:hypothetical protein
LGVEAYAFFDELWNQGRIETLFLELFRLLESRIKLIGNERIHATILAKANKGWSSIREELNQGKIPATDSRLEDGCTLLCELIQEAALSTSTEALVAQHASQLGRT